MRALAVLATMTCELAFADSFGGTREYQMVGISANSTSIYFKKVVAMMVGAEEWLAVWDPTGKQKTSQPILRNCSADGSWDPEARCNGGKQIDPKTGERTVQKIHATYGVPTKESVLAAKSKVGGSYLIDLEGPGHVQVFVGKGVEVTATSKLEGKTLPDLSDEVSRTVFFQLEVTVTAGTDTWKARTRVHADPVHDPMHAIRLMWGDLFVSGLAVAADRSVVALVFAGKPFVIPRPRAAPAKK